MFTLTVSDGLRAVADGAAARLFEAWARHRGCDGPGSRKDRGTHGKTPVADRDVQLPAVLRMLEEGQDCAEAVTRLTAVGRGLDRVGFAFTGAGLKQCPARAGGEDATDVQQRKKLVLSLA